VNYQRVLLVVACALAAVGAETSRAAPLTGTVLFPMTVPPGYASANASGYPQSAASGQVVGDGLGLSSNHALLWTGPGTPIDLNPSGFNQSFARGTDGSHQVGEARLGTVYHAMLWSGTAASAVDLQPLTGFSQSFAYGVHGSQQVGEGTGFGFSHALLWNGSAASAVDLNPAGFADPHAYGTDGTHQVGYGDGAGTGHNDNALLWNGTAASAINLNPIGFIDSYGFGVSGAQQVGYGRTAATGDLHALLWSGSAASGVDLNPAGVKDSFAFATNGAQQVGYGESNQGGTNSHALLWSGTAASAVNLQALLPASGTWQQSFAFSFDSSGDIFGVANGTYNGVSGNFAVEWGPVNSGPSVPLPAGACSGAVALLLAFSGLRFARLTTHG
jgi:hypothetical protein